MQLSHNGLRSIKELEGFRDKAYNDLDPNNPKSIKPGMWTIGYGTTRINGEPVKPGMTCTDKEAELWLQADLAGFQSAVNRLVKVPLTQNMYDALVSFTYNVGVGAFERSTLLRLLNQKKYLEAADQFGSWKFSGGKELVGLVKRRIIEKSKFLEGM